MCSRWRSQALPDFEGGASSWFADACTFAQVFWTYCEPLLRSNPKGWLSHGPRSFAWCSGSSATLAQRLSNRGMVLPFAAKNRSRASMRSARLRPAAGGAADLRHHRVYALRQYHVGGPLLDDHDAIGEAIVTDRVDRNLHDVGWVDGVNLARPAADSACTSCLLNLYSPPTLSRSGEWRRSSPAKRAYPLQPAATTVRQRD